MSKLQALLLGLALATGAVAHPMGNFSVSHYSRLDFNAKGLRLTYVLDLAEIPTLELLQQWQIDGTSDSQLQQKSATQAEAWLQNLSISVDGTPVTPRLVETKAKTVDGAGGMLVLRVVMKADVAAAPGQLSYEDRNYANRTGWKEIVVRGGDGIALSGAKSLDADTSHELTSYPADPTLAPPQDLAASVRWSANTPPVQALKILIPHPATKQVDVSRTAKQTPAPEMPSPVVAAPAASFAERQSAGPGSVMRGDFLSVMLRDKKFGWGSILLGLLVAFGLGAMHALSPGHGKTIVAAYLVGSRGTLKHALFLGSMVTFTHTISVFLLGIGVLFFQKYMVPDRIIPMLGAVSGLSIVSIGAWLLYQRTKALMATGEPAHAHEHLHAGEHHHDGHHHSHDDRHHLDHAHAHASHHIHQHAVAEVEASVAVMKAAHHHHDHDEAGTHVVHVHDHHEHHHHGSD